MQPGDADVEDNDDVFKDVVTQDDGNNRSSFVLRWLWILSLLDCGISKENTLLKNSYDAKKSAP